MYTIRKKFRFEMAHRLRDAFSERCKALHGHSYVCEVMVSSRTLNRDGMVLDFGALKSAIGSFLDSFDHATVLWDRDPLCGSVDFGKLVPVPYNPTAENMARDIAEAIASHFAQLEPPFEAITVRLHETETGYAEYSLTMQEFMDKITEANNGD